MPYDLPDQFRNFLVITRTLTLCTLLAVFSGCTSKQEEAEKPAAKKAQNGKPVLVELAPVKRGMIEEVLERSSALEAEAQVQVLARTQNPAIELFVEEGDVVEQGQVLLRLESDRQLTDHQQSKSQLEQARIEFESVESLFKQNLISEQEYRNAKFSFNQAELRAENTRRQLEYTEVRAPIKGTITSRTVKVGDSVSTGTPIFEIIDLESTVAVIHVPEQYIPKLKPNMQARLISSTLGDQVFEGYVKRVAPVVDAQAGTIKVVVAPKRLGALRPGMWVDVELVLDSKDDAILIEKRSIVYNNDQTFAYKAYIDADGVKRARRELVVPRNADKVHIEPTSGFEVGDLIVVAGQSGLKDDSPVRELTDPEDGVATTNGPPASVVQAQTNTVSSSKTTTAQKGS